MPGSAPVPFATIGATSQNGWRAFLASSIGTRPSSPGVAGGVVYVGSSDGSVYGLDARGRSEAMERKHRRADIVSLGK
jgi:outer membrane protein assembly factor BamB